MSHRRRLTTTWAVLATLAAGIGASEARGQDAWYRMNPSRVPAAADRPPGADNGDGTFGPYRWRPVDSQDRIPPQQEGDEPPILDNGQKLVIGFENLDIGKNKELVVTIEGLGVGRLELQNVQFKDKNGKVDRTYYSVGFNVAETSPTGATNHPKDEDNNPNVLKYKFNFPSCPIWEYIVLENIQNPINVAGWKITATCSCDEQVSVPDGPVEGSGAFGVPDQRNSGDQLITEMTIFPETSELNLAVPPTFAAPPESGEWTSDFVFEDPNGEPRPGGGVRWSTPGPGLAAGALYESTFELMGPPQLEYSVFAFDETHGRQLEFRTDNAPALGRAASTRDHAGAGAIAIGLDVMTRGDRSGSDFDDQIVGAVPAVESREGGVRRIEVDLSAPVVLADPAAITVRDAGQSYPPDTIGFENDDRRLVLGFAPGRLPDDTVYEIDLDGAFEQFRGDTDLLVVALTGDADGNGKVTDADLALIEASLGQPADEDNGRLDLDLDGVITPADINIAEINLGDSVLCPGSFPTVPWYEDFDEYDPGSTLHGGCGWKGWDDDPAFDAPVKDARGRSGAQSVEIQGDADLVTEFEGLDSGRHSFSAWQYIPSDFTSGGEGSAAGTYFILLNTYDAGGPYHWSVQMQFDSNDHLLKVRNGNGGDTSNVPYVTDRWVKIQTIVDLEDDWTRIYYDDALVTEYTWTGGISGDGGGRLDVAAVDLYAQGSSSVYYDDLKLEPITGCGDRLDSDADEDGLSLLDEFLADTDPCEADTDQDGMADGVDNCPSTPNPDQRDLDEDGVGDACDLEWTEPFDLYTEGPLPPQGGWEPWNGDPNVADFRVTSARARSAPFSVAIDGADDAVHRYDDYDAGTWEYSAWVYIPQEMDDVQYFILLNTYPTVYPDGWSLALKLDGATGVVRDDWSPDSVPMVRDAWAQIRVEIDLTQDRQRVFYNGRHVVTKSWSHGIGEGVVDFVVVDLWGAQSEHEIYYDDLRLAPLEDAPCPSDLDGSGVIDFGDLLAVLSAWGDCPGCPEDLDGSGDVGFSDLLIVLADWGACP